MQTQGYTVSSNPFRKRPKVFVSLSFIAIRSESVFRFKPVPASFYISTSIILFLPLFIFAHFVFHQDYGTRFTLRCPRFALRRDLDSLYILDFSRASICTISSYLCNVYRDLSVAGMLKLCSELFRCFFFLLSIEAKDLFA